MDQTLLGPAASDDLLDFMFQSTPSKPKPDPLIAIKSIHHQIFDKIVPDSPFWSTTATPLQYPTDEIAPSSIENDQSNCPKSAPKLGKDDIQRYLDKFQESQAYLPFIRLPANIAVEVMMKRHPFLLLGILAAMSMPDVYVHQKLDAKFKRVLSERTIEREEKSLDLLQGLLVYLAWYECIGSEIGHPTGSRYAGIQSI